MPVSAQHLIAKAEGTIDALKGMSPKEREKEPSLAFAEEYNRFRQMVIDANPDLAEIVPPAVTIVESSYTGQKGPDAQYAEILAYYSQIRRLL